MPRSLPLAIAYLAVLAFVVVAVLSLIPTKPRTRVVIQVLFGVLALLVLLQLVILGER